ncbi:MAG: hypothetical protein DME25_01760, partial [Verrucomicrobia bacterium]
MRRVALFVMLMCAAHVARSANLEWFTDAQAAQEKAKHENKLVLLDFTGSDWCGWCMRLKGEVFDKPEFAEFAQSRLIAVEVDFPRHKALSQPQLEANAHLARAYHITGYPTIILLNGEGQQVGRMGYVQGGPAALIARLELLTRARGQVQMPSE